MTWDGVPENWGKGHYRDIPWSKYVLLCRERQVRDLRRWLDGDPDFPYYFDTEAADHVVWFYSQLRHFDKPWTGEPFVLSDWQEWDIVRPLFGWKRKDDGTRRFRKCYKEIARGNGKTTLDGGIALYMLAGDQEFGGQCYTAATKEAQAKLLFDGARNLLKFNPALESEFKFVNGRLENEFLGSYFRPLGRDSKTEDGFGVHFGEIDEYHAHKTSGMLDVLESGTIKKTQPLISIITTAGEGLESPCRKESDFAKELLEGRHANEAYFVFVATVDNPKKWDDEQEWIKANPNWGISVNPTVFRGLALQAKQKPSSRHSFMMKNLNIWQQRGSRWLEHEWFDLRCRGKVDWSKFKHLRCFGGLDLGISRDISAFILAFVDGEITLDEKGQPILPTTYLKAKFWVPKECIELRALEDKVDYPRWVEEGWITATDGPTTRYDIVEADILKEANEFEIAEVAADQAHAYATMKALEDGGLTVVKHSQTIDAMTLPCKLFEAALINGRIRYDDNPVLRWMFDNAAIIRGRDDRMKVAKDLSTDRVDGVVAAVMAVGRLAISPEPVNVYDHRGIFVA